MARRQIMLDTNVLYDALSLLDEPNPDPQLERYRITRRGYAWLLLLLCHERYLETVSLGELKDQVIKLYPHENLPGRYFMQIFLWFVHDDLLRHWRWSRPNAQKGTSKTAADNEYLAFAKDHGLSLVTNEGWGPDGISLRSGSLRKKAINSGVPVYTSREFVEHSRFNPRRATAEFFRRWDKRVGQRKPLHSSLQHIHPVTIADMRKLIAEALVVVAS